MSKLRQVGIASDHFMRHTSRKIRFRCWEDSELGAMPAVRQTNRSCLLRAMTRRIRHCIECPKCRTRYLVGYSPYRNGSYL